MQRVTRADARQRLPERRVHVDVGGAPVEHLAVERAVQQIKPGVHAATGRERLEPQPVSIARHHRVAHPAGPRLRLVVAGQRHVGDAEQGRRGGGRLGHHAAEEPGRHGRAGQGLPAGGRQSETTVDKGGGRGVRVRLRR